MSLSHQTGLQTNDLIYPGNFKIVVPGGTWNGMVQSVSGAPKFLVGEEVMLLLKESQYGFSVSSLSLGKYRPIKDGIDRHWQSVVLPEDKELGRITENRLEAIQTLRSHSGNSE